MIPLSFAQQRLWFLAQLEGPSAAYNLPVAVRLTGELDHAALGAALADVLGRHEVLRTVFPAAGGQPRQQVIGMAELDWQLPVAEVTEAGLAQAVDAVATRPFELETEVPLRASLLRLGPDQHVLVVVIHHIAGDGWSMGILARDVSAAYAARRAGREPGWAPLPVQYADYALWQRELLGDSADPDSVLARQLGYWRRTLAGLPEELELPATRPRPAVRSQLGHSVPVDFPGGLHRQLADLARARGVTLYMVAQAALAVLLSKLGAGTDIPVGSSVAGRTDEGLDNLVGCFINTVVLRTDVSGAPSFTELLDQVKEGWLSALDHQDVPFERLVEELAPARSLARHPLFQVLLAVQNVSSGSLDLPGLTAAVLPAGDTTVRFDLHVSLIETFDPAGQPAGLRGSVMVCADLFDPEAAGQIASRLGRVLAAMAADPQLRPYQVDILSPAERQQILSGWNGPPAPLPAAGGVDELVAAQAAARPDGTAVACGDGGGAWAGCGTARGGWPGTWGMPESELSRWSGCAPSRAPSWCAWCWRHGGRGRRTCRWIRGSRPTGWRSCWPTRACRWWPERWPGPGSCRPGGCGWWLSMIRRWRPPRASCRGCRRLVPG